MQYQDPQIETRLVAEPINPAFRAPDPSIFDPPATGNRTFGTRARMRTTGWIAGDGNVVKSAEDAASLLASIRKNAQETVYSVATDKDGIVLEVHQYSKGTSGAAPLNMIEFVGRAMNVPGAAKLYWAHNHPGGMVSPSSEDYASHKVVIQLAQVGGIDVKGIVIAGTKWADLDDPMPQAIRPSLRKVKIPVKERTIVAQHSNPGPTQPISNSDFARKALKEMFPGKEGWLLLNTKNRVVGFCDFVPGQGAGQQAARLIQSAERLNASRGIFYSDIEPAPETERSKFLRGISGLIKRSFEILDVLYGENGSMADQSRLEEVTYTAFPNLDFELLRENRPVFWEESAQPWYSQMRAYLDEKLPGSGFGPKLADAIESWAKKGFFKPEEIEWIGLADWLRAQPGKVSKADILAFVDEHSLEIKEIVKGETTKPVYRIVNWDDVVIEDGFKTREDAEAVRDELEDELDEELVVESSQGVDELTGELPPDAGDKETRFSKYQLSGGENYREMLVTMPVDQTPANVVGFNVIRSNDGRLISQHTTRESAEYWLESGHEIVPIDKYGSDARTSGSSAFRSGHWPGVLNVLAHVRFNERTGPNGKRVLFIEEVQSDWHQTGRKEGYKGKPSEMYEVRKDRNGAFRAYAKNGELIEPLIDGERVVAHFDEGKLRRAVEYEINQGRHGQGMVPDAPWKKAWPLKVMQRMVRYAAENGFDAIAWTPGDVQAKRYDLSKQVDWVAWDGRVVRAGKGRSPLDPPLSVAARAMGASNASRELITKKALTQADLERVVGKAVASRLVERKQHQDLALLEGEADLNVGGEGMKGFYDKILPSEANKFFGKKAWGNPKVGTTEIFVDERQETGRFEIRYDTVTGWEIYNKNTDRRVRKAKSREEAQEIVKRLETKRATAQVWHLPITPEMKHRALTEGIPLFYRGFTRGRHFLGANPKARVFKIVTEAMRYWENPPPVKICGSEQELPAEIAMFAAADKTVYGAFWNGTVYLVANHLPDRDTTLKALFHEAIGHYGLSLMGETGQAFLNRLYYSKLSEIRELALRQGICLDNDSGQRLAAEEWLARQAVARPHATWVDRSVRTMKDWIRDKLRINVKVSDREIRAWLADMRRVVVQGPDRGKMPVRAREARFFTAYHGTPHTWEPEPGFPHGRPRLDKIGTGEGVSAYGWGWYSTGMENAALSYRTATLPPRVTIRGIEYRADADGVLKDSDGKTIDSLPVYLQTATRALIGSRSNQKVEVLAEEAESYLQARTGLSLSRIAKIKEAILNGEITLETDGNIYKIDIPDDVSEKLLDWDKPLSEQSEYVRKALAKVETSWAKHLRGEDQPDFLKAFIPATGGEAYGHLAGRPLSTGQGKKAASEYLASLGIVGCRYVRQSSRGFSANTEKDKKSSFNYVVWDQETLDRVGLIAQNGKRPNKALNGTQATKKISDNKKTRTQFHTTTYSGTNR